MALISSSVKPCSICFCSFSVPARLVKKVLKKDGVLIIVSPNKFYKFFYFFFNLFNKYWPDETISKHYSFGDLIKITKKEWRVLEAFSYSINNKKIIYTILNSRFILVLKKINER